MGIISQRKGNLVEHLTAKCQGKRLSSLKLAIAGIKQRIERSRLSVLIRF